MRARLGTSVVVFDGKMGDAMSSTEPAWTVVCDFDGTISNVDVTDQLLERYADPEWLDIEAQWKSGEIGSWECLSRQLDVLRASPAQIEAVADAVSIDLHFLEFAEYCAARRVPLVVVSDGLDHVITRILRRYNLSHLPVYANSFLTFEGNAHRLVSPHRSEACCSGAGTCKCQVVADLIGGDKRRILFVGDGQSDFCVAGRLPDVVAAKAKLLAHLNASGRSCVPYRTFADVQSLLTRLLPKRQLVDNLAGDAL